MVCAHFIFTEMKVVVYSRLQRVQNAAARVILELPKFCHITAHLHDLHWLPVSYRISFKIALTVFKCLHNMAPGYLSELICYLPDVGRTSRSRSSRLLHVPSSKRKTFGDRAFAVAGPTIWNSLPVELRSIDNVNTFKTQLKTHLFKRCY